MFITYSTCGLSELAFRYDSFFHIQTLERKMELNSKKKIRGDLCFFLKGKHCIRHMWCVNPNCQKLERSVTNFKSNRTLIQSNPSHCYIKIHLVTL